MRNEVNNNLIKHKREHRRVKWLIISSLPSQVLKKKDGSPVYETNYFCRVITYQMPKGGVIGLNEWDTDKKFALRFDSKKAAEEFHKKYLMDLDGCEFIMDL